ncbi:MAG: murein biosynthesis integral membrane protein MurJ [Candidatus Eisenbacteria bacterium]
MSLLGRRIGTVTALSVAANLAALARNASIAARFGVSRSADLVVYAEAVLLFLPTILLVRETFAAFVSVYGHALEEDASGERAARLRSSGLRATALAAGALSLAVVLWPVAILRMVAPGLGPEQIETGARLLRAVAPALFFTELAEFAKTIHNAHHRYAVPALVMLTGNLLQTAVLLAFPPTMAYRGWMFALDGAALAQALLLVLLLPGWPVGALLRHPLLPPELRRVGTLVAPVALGVFLVQAAGYIERAVLSFLPAGSLSMLAYSRKLIAPLQTVLAASVALPIYVTMSRDRSAGGADRAHTLARGLDLNLFLFLPITAFVLLLAPQIVELAFQRGLFDAQDVHGVATLLRIGVLGVLPVAVYYLLRDFSYATQRTRPLALAGGIQLVVTGIANLLALRFGLLWVPIGVATGLWTSCVVLLAIVHKRLPASLWSAAARGAGAALAGAATSAVAAAVLLRALPAVPLAGWGDALLDLAAAGIAGLLAYFLVLWMLRHPFARTAMQRIRG